MIFTGDLVFPSNFNKKIIGSLPKDFLENPKIVNSEALIDFSKNTIHQTKRTKGIALISSREIIQFMHQLNIVGASLANNHITDFDLSINEQIDFYAKNNISAFGGGDEIKKASKPFVNDALVVLSFGWKVIGCNYATANSKGVNPLMPHHIFDQVKSFRIRYPHKKLIILFHWNYEFELYPQPAHRKLSFDLIDAGVDAIFGHHSHIVQGFELYKAKPVFYGLGNFYLPEQEYLGYNLKYPEEAQIGLAVQFNSDLDKCICYWVKNDDDNKLSIIQKENALDSLKLKELTPYAGYSHQDYIKWFKKNRIKRKLLPVYSNYDSRLNPLFDSFVAQRNSFINFLVKNGLK